MAETIKEQTFPHTPDDSPCWNSFTIGFTGSSDTDAIHTVLHGLEGYNLRLTLKGERPADVNLISANEHHDAEPDGRQWGIHAAPIDQDGNVCGETRYVAYEDIERLDVY